MATSAEIERLREAYEVYGMIGSAVIFAAIMIALYRRERYGRDVLGRAAIGMHRDPLTVTMPKPDPLAGAELARFRAATAPAMAQLKRVEGVRLAAR